MSEKVMRELLRAIRKLQQSVDAMSAGRAMLDVKQAAASLSVSERTAWRMVVSGELPSRTIGKRRLIPAAAVARYGEAKGAAPRPSSRPMTTSHLPRRSGRVEAAGIREMMKQKRAR